jgi:hypothetical protein
MSEEIKLFEFGSDGGGTKVFILNDNSIIERGISGGILDEVEDPIINWERKFESWEIWWQQFKKTHESFWVYFYPIFIHQNIKPFIKTELDNYEYSRKEASSQLETWDRKLSNHNY